MSIYYPFRSIGGAGQAGPQLGFWRFLPGRRRRPLRRCAPAHAEVAPTVCAGACWRGNGEWLRGDGRYVVTGVTWRGDGRYVVTGATWRGDVVYVAWWRGLRDVGYVETGVTWRGDVVYVAWWRGLRGVVMDTTAACLCYSHVTITPICYSCLLKKKIHFCGRPNTH